MRQSGRLGAQPHLELMMNIQTIKTRRTRLDILYPMILSCFVTAMPNQVSGQWTQFGGPSRDFNVNEGGVKTPFPPDGPRTLWERELGPGQAPFMVDGRSAYTMYRDGDQEVVIALNAQDGEVLWEVRYDAPIPEGFPPANELVPRTTAVLSGVRIFTVGSLGHVNCINQETGKLIWSHNPVADGDLRPPKNGYSASPLTYMDRVLVAMGTENDRTENLLYTFHQRSGSFLWRKLNGSPAHVSPVVAKSEPRDQLLLATPDKLLGAEPLNAIVYWELPLKKLGTPVWNPYRRVVLLPSVSEEGSGVYTLENTKGAKPIQLWKRADSRYRQFISEGNLVIGAGVGEGSRLCAHRLESGDVLWCDEDFHTPYLLYTGDKLIILDQKGTLAIADVSDAGLRVLAKTNLETHGEWAAPSIEHRRLFLRDHKRALAIDLR